MATTMVNGAPGAEGNPTITVPAAGKQQSAKPAATANKSMDASRKQTSNPGEGVQR